MEYYITKHDDGSYTIGKFDGQDHIVTYTIKGKKCDCPSGSRRGYCKHIAMVAKWKPGHYYENDRLRPLSFTEQLIQEDLDI